MNNLGKTLICGIAALFAITAMADAPESVTQFTPKLMNYQGYLADPSTGKAYADGIYHLQCRLYRVAVEGTAIWGGEYAVYVNGGYFNIMLGDPSAEDLKDDNCTYSNTNLWRAIWSDASVANENERNNLWLGVTPLENSKNNAVASPAEIKPRQQLLTAPYAFRAQSAEYANESYGDFTANGALTATEIKLPSGQSWDTNNFSVSNEVATIQTSGNTSISAGGNLNMSASGNTALSASGTATISAGCDMYVLPGTDKVLYGQGSVMWKSAASGGYKKPFVIKTINIPVEDFKEHQDTFHFFSTIFATSDIVDSEYRYMVGNVEALHSHFFEQLGLYGPAHLALGCDVQLVEGNTWRLTVTTPSTEFASVKVTLLGVLKELVDDQR